MLQKIAESENATVQSACTEILTAGTLKAKLTTVTGIPDKPGSAVFIEEPTRGPGLLMGQQKYKKLPKVGRLGDPEAAARVICCFAHHELMAVELFAWALLAFPETPASFRRGLVFALSEEQLHFQLYLDVLDRRGFSFDQFGLNGYFWEALPTAASDNPTILGFLAAMGLTLEQANLDFTIHYRDGFAAAGDEEVAEILQRIHDDEVGHVALARTWFSRLSSSGKTPTENDDVENYKKEVPFPLSGAKAKGRNFQIEPRRRAGLSERFIEYIQNKPQRYE